MRSYFALARRVLCVSALALLIAALGACDRDDAGQPDSTRNERAGAEPTRAEPTRAEPTKAAPAPTNLLLITLDTVRADSLGVYGQKRVVTPHIDAFSQQGVLFEDCVSSSPSTLPSHASLFTGRHPFEHGVRSNSGYALGEAELTLAEVLRSKGYRTRAEIASEVMTEKTRIDQGFSSFHGVDADDVKLQKLRITEGGEQRETVLMARPASDITRHGIRFLETAKPLGTPFFLWLHYFDPHRPHAPPERFNARIPDDPYLAEVAYTDHSVGDVLTALIRLDLSDNTLVVITSDHGEGLGEHDEHSHAFFLYDTTTRVPLIMVGPGVARGKRVAPLVRSIDIAPTILDLLALPPLPSSRGVSLRAMMATGPARPAAPLTGYGESIELRKAFGSPVLRFARQEEWKYIHSSPPELYNVKADPSETDNAATREPQHVARLRGVLEGLLRGASAPEAAKTLMDAATQRQLEALGYLAAQAPSIPDEIASLALDERPALDQRPAGFSVAADVLQLNVAKGHASYDEHDKAVKEFRDLRTRHPNSPELLRQLVASLHHLKDKDASSQDEIQTLFRQASKLDPENGVLFAELAEISLLTGHLEGAVNGLRHLLELEPCDGPPRSSLVGLFREVGRHYEAFEVARQGVLRCPELPSALNDMAWVFATSQDDELRDGAQAADLAERALSLEPNNLGFRDTLAAAYAESGDYTRAAQITAQTISELQRLQAPEQAIAEFQKHLAEFRAGRALRE